MTRSSRRAALLVGALLVGLPASEAAAQDSGADSSAFLDPVAESLYRAARAEWDRVDETVVRYTAVVKQRLAASLRTLLKDRTLYRAESAHRVFWDRDGESLVQVLALREQTPAGVEEGNEHMDWFEDAFDPAGDRLLFGLAEKDEEEWGEQDDEFWVAHPLVEGATNTYRYRTGDTLTLGFPDGQRLQAVELQVIPRVLDVHSISGSLWIEPESGALVRAVYRLADTFDALRDLQDPDAEEGLGYVPGIFKPITFELALIAVEYGLWDFEAWLPRAMRAEGILAAGIVKAPGTMDVSYRIESVVTESDLAKDDGDAPLPPGITDARHFSSRAEAMAFMAELAGREGVAYQVDRGTSERAGRTTRFLVPEDSEALITSTELPPPIWDEAVGFPTEADVDEMLAHLDEIPVPERTTSAWAFNWGFERPDLVRFNRIEGPAVGARLQVRFGSPIGPLSFVTTPFFGVGDVDVKARAALTHEGLRRKVSIGVYRELRAVTERGRHLGLGNSAAALLWGRDDGEYFQATGADLTWTPPSADREWFRVRAYAERHRSVSNHTKFSLSHAFEDDWAFRPNVVASEHDEVGGELSLRPWWGSDPLAPEVSLEFYGQVASADSLGTYSRASLLLRGSIPFRALSQDLRTSLEIEGGRGWGSIPTQREWYLGSVHSLRGYEASTLHGRTFTRGRFELARVFPVTSVGVFTDAGWVGHRPDDFHFDDVLVSVGIGASVLDGLLRLDLSRGLVSPSDTRFDFYLDAAF